MEAWVISLVEGCLAWRSHPAVAAVPAAEALALAQDAGAVAGAHVAVQARVHGVHRLRDARLAAHSGRDGHVLRV